MKLSRQNKHQSDDLPLDNDQVAKCLEEVADLLEEQAANVFRVRAYRGAAAMLRQLKKPACALLEEDGLPGLMQLEGIGRTLARAIEQLTFTGRLSLLDRLRGSGGAEKLFATVPGIGRDMAARIHEQLDFETLADLEASAYDGRLAKVPGMGRKRIRAVRESLAGRFRNRPRVPESGPSVVTGEQPSVAELLDVDREYRAKAEGGHLYKIAPRRFNPTGAAWLPVLHTERDERHYTVLFSNTARAHELGTVHDWVVIYRDDADSDGQWTVITSRYGQLRGRRIVRGREDECAEYYASHQTG